MTSAQKVRNVGAVKQGANTMSKSAGERGRLGVGIGGDLLSGGAADACVESLGLASRPPLAPARPAASPAAKIASGKKRRHRANAIFYRGGRADLS